jgi:hypothetical protein
MGLRKWWTVSVVWLAIGCGPGGDDEASGGGSAGTADGSSSSSTGTLDDGSSESVGTSSDTGGDSTGADSTGGEGPPAYCPGVPEHTEPVCRDEDDCPTGHEACGPTAPVCGGAGGCVLRWGDGPPCATDRECVDFDGAGTDGVCRFGVDPCCGEVANCIAACTPDSCAPGETCDADGHCRPIPCDAGYACARGSTCDPAVDGGDVHGCVIIPCDQPDALPCAVDHACTDGTCQRIPCVHDVDCPCGSCIQSQCWDRPWICYSEPA